ncbi:MAG: phenylalanine--tRNA ligase subunit alpha [Mycoplasmataceae bacterium]|nr:phenylalanine--tRNA ligase subunit alpha [Mycoplasmataceae bacterium]
MELKKEIESIKSIEDLKNIKNKIYGKEGIIFALQKKLKDASIEDKSKIGIEITKIKDEASRLLEAQLIIIANLEVENKINDDMNDIFEHSEDNFFVHPLTLIEARFRQWFLQNSYLENQGIEIESDKYNFEKLNIPQNHPSRDMQDTLYINKENLLRTHNTGLTARVLEQYKNKSFSAFTIGKVYRNDEDDQTHSHQFSQVDLVSVGDLNIENLIWSLKSLLSHVFEEDVEIRLRPSFFPFTEPSMEVDVFFKDKWIEILGAGMLNEKILKIAGYTNDLNGFAAGIGVERVAMIKYGINDIREFYKNDLRFLKQFKY